MTLLRRSHFWSWIYGRIIRLVVLTLILQLPAPAFAASPQQAAAAAANQAARVATRSGSAAPSAPEATVGGLPPAPRPSRGAVGWPPAPDVPLGELWQRTLNQEDECLTNNPQLFVDDPVNTRTGTLGRVELDLELPTRGLPLRFERSYSSGNFYTGPFGSNWTHSYNMALVFGNGEVQLRAPRSSLLPFSDDGQGHYTAQRGVRATLTRSGPPYVYTLTRADQIVYTFDATGRLTSLTDSHGNTTTLVYETNPLTGNKVLVQIAASGGRSLSLSYNNQDRITQLRDPASRDVTYFYDQWGVLVEVVAADGGHTGYTYDNVGGTLEIRTVTGPNGQVDRFSYIWPYAMVASHTDPLGHTTSFQYVGPDPEGRVFTTITDPYGRATVHRYQHGAEGYPLSELVAITDTLGNGTWFDYDPNYNLTSVTNALGRRTEFTWNANSCSITSIRDAAEGLTSMQYDARNNLTSRTDALGRTTTFVYDTQDNLTQITDPLGSVTGFGYDAYGQLRSVTDAHGNVTGFGHDQYGDLTVITDTLGGITRLTYDLAGRPLTVRDALGRETDFVFDPAGRPLQITDALDGVTSYQYDLAGNLTRLVDANSHATTVGYNAAGRPVTITDALNGRWLLGYDWLGHGTVITDAMGHATRLSYDPVYRLATITDARGGVTGYGYDAIGNRTVITDANSHFTRYAYDVLNRVVTVTNQLDGQVIFGYDAVSNLTSLRDPLTHTWRWGYDRLDRPVVLTDTLGHPTRAGYDRLSNLTVITDTRGITTTYGYDPLNRLTRVTDGRGGVTGYRYDAVGNRTVITDANGHVTTLRYDALNRLERRTLPLGQHWDYGYDRIRSVTAITDALGVRVNYAYDALDRLTAIDYPAPQGDVVFDYDAVGNRMDLVDPTGITTYQYDELDRLTRVTDPASRAVGYQYDPVGNRTRVTYPGGTQVNYTYDVLDRLATVTSPSWPELGTAYTYDAASRLTRANNTADTLSSVYTYDDANRLLSVSHFNDTELWASFGYIYDEVGNRTRAEENLQGASVTIDYGYDNLYRLLTANQSDGRSQTYTYDAVGNRTRLVETVSGQTTTTDYTYDANDRLTAVNLMLYSWDNNGNLLSDGTHNYSYDAADRLTAITGGGLDLSFTYNGDGLRVAQAAGPGLPTPYVWDVGQELPQVLVEGGNQYAYGLGLLSRWNPATGEERGYRLDGQGSVRLLLDTAQPQVLSTYRYDPFGRLLAGDTSNTRRYTGEQQDTSGLYYLRARYYDPATGRFLTRDPFPGLATWPATQQPYAYAVNNPLRYSDPSGQFINILIGGAIGGIVGAAAYSVHWHVRSQVCSCEKFDWGDFATVVGVGLLSGGLIGSGVGILPLLGSGMGWSGLGYMFGSMLARSPFSRGDFGIAVGMGMVTSGLGPVFGTTRVGASLLSGAGGLAQYAITQSANGKPWEAWGLAYSFATGVGSGVLAGPYTTPTVRVPVTQVRTHPNYEWTTVGGGLRPAFPEEVARGFVRDTPRSALATLISAWPLQFEQPTCSSQ